MIPFVNSWSSPQLLNKTSFFLFLLFIRERSWAFAFRRDSWMQEIALLNDKDYGLENDRDAFTSTDANHSNCQPSHLLLPLLSYLFFMPQACLPW